MSPFFVHSLCIVHVASTMLSILIKIYNLLQFFSLSLFVFDIVCPLIPYRDALIEQLMREIVELKEKISELQDQRDADRELMAGLRDRLQQMETELNDYKEIAEQTCNVSTTPCGEVGVADSLS